MSLVRSFSLKTNARAINITRLTALLCLLRSAVLFKLSLHLLRQLLKNEIVGITYQRFQLPFTQHIELSERDPVITRRVGRRIDAVLFGQFGKLLRSTLERKTILRCAFQNCDGEHLAANLEDQIVSPLNFFSDVGKRKAVSASLFNVHGSFWFPLPLGEG